MCIDDYNEGSHDVRTPILKGLKKIVKNYAIHGDFVKYFNDVSVDGGSFHYF